MLPSQKLLLGAALGALITLFAHPLTRPYLLHYFVPPLNAQAIERATMQSYPERLEAPQKDHPLEAALWMRIAAQRRPTHQQLTKNELQSALTVATLLGENDQKNAFWPQMQAYFWYELGQINQARQAWKLAATRPQWSDYQRETLFRQGDAMSASTGNQMSWQLAKLYYARSTSIDELIYWTGSRLLNSAKSDQEIAEMRYAMLRNGDLVRSRATFYSTGQSGAKMVELAAHPLPIQDGGSLKQLLISKLEFINELKRLQMNTAAQQTDRIYRANESWNALISPGDVVRDQTIISILSCSLPSSLLATFLVGLILWVFGKTMQLYSKEHAKIDLTFAVMSGGIIGYLIWRVTHMPLATVAIGMAIAFVALGPKQERTRASDDLGPLFNFAIAIVCLSTILLMTFFFMGSTTAAVALLPELQVPHEYFGGSWLVLSVALLIFSMVFLIAPLWSFTQRRRTTAVFALALRRIGKCCTIFCLFFAIVMTPLAVYFDLQSHATFEKLIGNEPLYYLSEK